MAQNYLTRGFWGDEAWTSLISQLPYLSMLKTTAADFHPPAYYTVVELWYKIFPETEVSTRLISVIFYFLTVFLVYKLVYFISTSGESKPFRVNLQGEPTPEVIRKGRVWGLITAAVVLVNPIFFAYAFEARNYTLFAFAATGSIYFLLRILAHPRGVIAHPGGGWLGNVVGFVLFSTLGIYTHYYMFFTLAAQGLYILIWERKILLKMIGLWTIVAVLYLPWIPFLFSQVTSVGQGYWIGRIDGRTHFEALLRILSGEYQNIFRPILFWLLIGLIIIGLFQHLRQKSFERPYILIWLWAIVPFILASLPGLRIERLAVPFRPVFFWRYLIPAAVPLSMVIVHAAQKLPGDLFKLAIGSIIILSLAIDYLTFLRYPTTFKQVYEQEVLPNIESTDKFVTVLPSFAEVLYYRNRNGLSNELVVLPEGLVQFSGKSLLDAYVENGVVRIDEKPGGSYFELRPGPSIRRME